MKKKLKLPELKIQDADLVLVQDFKLALALKYEPGKTPYIIAKGKDQSAQNIIWQAQELDIPVLEIPTLQVKTLAQLKEGSEIPESLYRPTAQAIALLFRVKDAPYFIRFLRRYKRAPGKALRKNFELVESLAPVAVSSPLTIELGELLWQDKDFLKDILNLIRQRIALELGLALQEFNLQKNNRLTDKQYAVKLKESVYYEGSVELAMEREERYFSLLNKVKQVIYQHAADFLTYVQVEALLEALKGSHSGLLRALFPRYLNLPALRLILKNLLSELIPIRDLPSILETILDYLPRTSDPDLLTEFVRTGFSAYLCQKYKDAQGYLNVFLIGPKLERKILSSIKESVNLKWLDLSAEEGLSILSLVGENLKPALNMGISPVILCSPLIRRFIYRLLEGSFPELPVLSYSEIVPLTEVRSLGVLEL
jgi:flagellar biosynthesis component FlhA/type III secretion system FlhB-like substrate exporter